MQKSLRATAVALAVCLALTLSGTPGGAATERSGADKLADKVASRVTLLGMGRHLIAFQKHAWQHGGRRAPGTPGYEASKQYVVNRLTNAGFDVSIQEFPVRFSEAITERLVVGGNAVSPMHMMLYTKDTPVGGITARLSAIPATDATPGCEAGDFASASYTGTIVVIQRGVCAFAVKLANAANAGAAAVVFYNNTDTWLRGSLGSEAAAVIPSGGVSKSVGEQLVAQAGTQATLELRVLTEMRTGRTVIAQTRTGRKDNVVMAGAHLDSVVEGPGISTNGSGAAALLETALQLGGSPRVANAVRFVFWGSWEFGIISSPYYVSHLTAQEKLDIAMYLNFDGIASPNAGYFVYDGDNAGTPAGSPQIKKAFVDALGARGVQPDNIPMNSRFEHFPFVAAGIPSGGLHTGLQELKTQEQAAKWGGNAGVAFDVCYHESCDTLRNLNVTALVRNAKAIARVVTSYAVTTSDATYGIPERN